MPRPDHWGIECPKCCAAALRTKASPYFDHCGLETYELECLNCNAVLIGIVDPFDDALLLSVKRKGGRHPHRAQVSLAKDGNC